MTAAVDMDGRVLRKVFWRSGPPLGAHPLHGQRFRLRSPRTRIPGVGGELVPELLLCLGARVLRAGLFLRPAPPLYIVHHRVQPIGELLRTLPLLPPRGDLGLPLAQQFVVRSRLVPYPL